MKKQALVIGNNNYKDNALKYCIKDAQEISQLLSTNGDGKIENFKVNSRSNLTADEMKKSIKTLFHAERDVALLYYSGHGGVDKDNNNTCIVGVDGKRLMLSDILQMLIESKAKSKVLIFDSCFSGAMGKISDGIIPGLENSILPRGTVILTACRDDEPSIEKTDLEHGIFTDLLISALQGQAADLRGYITPASIYSYIDSTLGELGGQRPVFKSNVEEFIPIRQVDAILTSDELNIIDEYFDDKDSCYKLDSSYEETNIPEGDLTKSEIFTQRGFAVSHNPPYANTEHIKVFKLLQKYNRAGLVEPVDAEHMYGAAMNAKSCRLTNLGKFYWKIAENNRF